MRYTKLIWKNMSICSRSDDKTLIFNKTELTKPQFDVKKYLKWCAVGCQKSFAESCNAFQVNWIKSVRDSQDTNDDIIYDVICYHVKDIPENIYVIYDDTCYLYFIENPVYIEILAWGNDDLYEYPNAKKQSSNILTMNHLCGSSINRGVNLYKLDMTSPSLYDYRNFDYYHLSSWAMGIKQYLEETPIGTVVLGQTCDEPYTNLFTVEAFLKSVNLDVAQLQFRGKWLQYSRMQWLGESLCSNSTKKMLALTKIGVSIEMIEKMRLVKKCAFQCQKFIDSCFAFQINLLDSASVVDEFDFVCYHFSDIPDSIFTNLQDNCSLYISGKPIYMSVSSWGMNDADRDSYDSNKIEVLGGGKYEPPHGSRGVFIFKLNTLSHTLYDFDYFGYYNVNNSAEATRFRDVLTNIPSGTIIVGRTGDEPYNGIAPIMSYLRTVNLDVSSLLFRGKWIFLWQQGGYEKSLSFISNVNVTMKKLFVVCNVGSDRLDWTGIRMQTIN
ncbi:hypothetical protein HELRODRAFT_183850 [Helobdella robusta]|uniref:ILEI/PANDER domain-containing protein n=1 Tax=Helobdella robusta TaxID=6412 RepID=T1FK96_HELRO|nr:hypothetical protein HELRODRAFT_183850 [Helobdella robusta]ESO09803.1 hypothetical protein HELRODRAFT_183850 [Helobdella robusta]